MNLPITITDRDARRLGLLVQAAHLAKGPDAENLKRLKIELDRAKVVAESELPQDVICMNSTVELEDLTDGDVSTFTLVYPDTADISSGRLSILAPLGMAVLGFRVGDEFEWPIPAGTVRARVRRLVSRESAAPVPVGA